MTQYNKRTSTGNYTIYLLVENISQDTEHNQSKIRYKAWITGNSGTSAWGSGSWSANIAGTSSSGTIDYNFGNTKTYYCVGSSSSYVTTDYIPHNPDGTKSVAVSFAFSGTSLVGSATISETFTLNTIPRTSSLILSSTAFTISNLSTGFAFRVDSEARFYHKVIWSIGGSETVAYDQVLIDGTGNTEFILPQAMLAKMPNSYLGTMRITAITYRNQAETTEIGRVSRDVTVSVDTNAIKPSVSMPNLTVHSSPSSSITVPVAGYSKVKCQNWTTTNSSGAGSVTTYFKLNRGSFYAGDSSTGTTGTVITNNVLESGTDYTLTMSAFAIDSRGARSDTVSKSITIYGYTKPTAELIAYRTKTNNKSDTQEDGSGAYAYIAYSNIRYASIRSQNSASVTAYKQSIDGGTATNITANPTHITLTESQTAEITLIVTDKVSSQTFTVKIAPAKYPLDLYDSGDGTVGAGIGGSAKANGFHLYLDQHGYSGKKIIYHTQEGDSIEHDLAGLLFDETGGGGGGSGGGGGGGGTDNYNDLNNKPSINGTTLIGNVTLATLGIQPAGNYATESYVTNYHDNTKQDKLTAGDNITIDGNTISSTGGISGRDRIKLDNAITGVTLDKDTDTVLGTGTTFTLTSPTISAGATTRYLSASASGTAVGADGTASVIKSISSAKASVPIPTAKTSKLVTTTIPNVTSAGSASTWVFSMGDGTTYDNETLVISGANSTAPTLGTAITAATGSVASDGGGATVSTGLNVGSMLECDVNIGTTTETVLTGVKVTTQPTITLTANSSTATGRITYVQSSSPSLSGGGITVGTNDPVTVLTDSTSITTSTS